MYELIKVTDSAYYIDCPSRIGIVKLTDEKVCLVDSGNSKDTAKKVMKHLSENGWELSAIYITHSHADHTGGNKYLQNLTGCKIYAPPSECDIARKPILECAYLYGANPPSELRTRFLLSDECQCEMLNSDVLPDGIEAIPLPGHSFNMVGYRTSDGAFFVADALASKETLEKYKISFIYDVGKYINTLEKLKSVKDVCFIPSHLTHTSDIGELIQYNIDFTLSVTETVEKLCNEPISFDDLLARVFDVYGLNMTFEQHALAGSTVRAHLTYLKDLGRIKSTIDNNTLLYCRNSEVL